MNLVWVQNRKLRVFLLQPVPIAAWKTQKGFSRHPQLKETFSGIVCTDVAPQGLSTFAASKELTEMSRILNLHAGLTGADVADYFNWPFHLPIQVENSEPTSVIQ